MNLDIKLYLKPRPIYPQLGDRPWMLIRPDFSYEPSFPTWQPILLDATEAHTVYSPTLATALTKIYVAVLPKVRKYETDIPRIKNAIPDSPFNAVKISLLIVGTNPRSLRSVIMLPLYLPHAARAPSTLPNTGNW
ncbi:hypothetical protein EV421DRAFT_1896328 [Armillaria borealis]|uniref:Uncharacterized protein n=1 Tax=Armillaria borealis TaxID=47425 RepID=A0AA39K4K2_9AGAR|nr:hypothetical protein EV421DRAFT_1896328 [Armillaria borealis]